MCTHPSNTFTGQVVPWVRYVIRCQSRLVLSGSSTFVTSPQVHSTQSLVLNSHHSSSSSLGHTAALVFPFCCNFTLVSAKVHLLCMPVVLVQTCNLACITWSDRLWLNVRKTQREKERKSCQKSLRCLNTDYS